MQKTLDENLLKPRNTKVGLIIEQCRYIAVHSWRIQQDVFL